MKEKLENDGYVYIKNFLSEVDCDLLVSEFYKAEKGYLDTGAMGLNDSSDRYNIVYESNRSPLSYCYLSTEESMQISKEGIKKLEQITGLIWSGNINEKYFPIFKYGLGGYIERHRGRDVGYGRNDYVAVTMLTKPNNDFSQGKFFLNKDAIASTCGKIIEYENPEGRIYVDIQQGDLLIFDNRIHVHGTEPAQKGSAENVCRMTTSWRTEFNT
ncbi:hypothetical protein [Acinetobacter beijerinckii]|uniref:TauD/TfdA-like domain-containing protein n=1 Tax=Acinetobacter beijerinckii CIP 110307 TaxID=1217648 RepID=N9FQT7_9GAMM|nr:hypothetical protein [Acinetobacter beijerinckii]ENW07311.1 hypothetical protein F933_01779 [Acinetobacter beijerinckii CIP 110307]